MASLHSALRDIESDALDHIRSREGGSGTGGRRFGPAGQRNGVAALGSFGLVSHSAGTDRHSVTVSDLWGRESLPRENRNACPAVLTGGSRKEPSQFAFHSLAPQVLAKRPARFRMGHKFGMHPFLSEKVCRRSLVAARDHGVRAGIRIVDILRQVMRYLRLAGVFLKRRVVDAKLPVAEAADLIRWICVGTRPELVIKDLLQGRWSLRRNDWNHMRKIFRHASPPEQDGPCRFTGYGNGNEPQNRCALVRDWAIVEQQSEASVLFNQSVDGNQGDHVSVEHQIQW